MLYSPYANASASVNDCFAHGLTLKFLWGIVLVFYALLLPYCFMKGYARYSLLPPKFRTIASFLSKDRYAPNFGIVVCAMVAVQCCIFIFIATMEVG